MNKKYVLIFIFVLLMVLIVSRATAQKILSDPKQFFPNTIGFRTKNPCNINKSDNTKYKGEIGSMMTDDGLKRVFSDVRYGCLAASERLRTNYFTKGLNTIEKIAPVWTGGHSVSAWTSAVEKVSGVNRREILSGDSKQMRQIIKGMVFAENSVILQDYYLSEI